MPERGLRLALFSLHGLIRGENPELGRDADTGGQITYVLELARALGRRPEVERVDLFTRWIRDRRVSDDYGRPVEPLGDRVRLVRLRCGGPHYRRKELLWPHLDEFVDRALEFFQSEGGAPDVVHGHYADAGLVALEVGAFFGVPVVFTGHSLGRSKKARLAEQGLSEEDMNRRYHIDQRIAAEEKVLRRAHLVVASTHQEVREQYALYDAGTPRFEVIPPGLDLSRFVPYYHDDLADRAAEERMQARAAMTHELNRFLSRPDKPLILALCRPDARKNIPGLIHAYGSDKELQAIANLAIFAGIRKDIARMEDNEREVLTEMLLLMDRYDLYGRMAIPKKHEFAQEVPALYRLAASRFGVFVNPAFTEPFGLTLLEAAACGLPLVATRDGGPVDIVANCGNGLLVDVRDEAALAGALREILVDREKWKEFSRNGIMKVREHYSWEAHCAHYLQGVRDLVGERSPARGPVLRARPGRPPGLERVLVADLDEALLGEPRALPELTRLLEDPRGALGFVVTTGRAVESARAVLSEQGLPVPDVLITSVGTGIYYGAEEPDHGWSAHIGADWRREALESALAELPFLQPQRDQSQRRFKLSYLMEDSPDLLDRIHAHLAPRKLRYALVFSYGRFLDVLPARASKGKAVRWLASRWGLPLSRFLVAGATASDADMLGGEPWGVVVSNHSPELSRLRGRRRVWFSRARGAAAVVEALSRFRFLEGEPVSGPPRGR